MKDLTNDKEIKKMLVQTDQQEFQLVSRVHRDKDVLAMFKLSMKNKMIKEMEEKE